jgi:predicted ATP-grasp superfamily ATP-dependent carboligase
LNQKYLFDTFFKNKKFIFQYFFNPDFTSAYIDSCKHILEYNYEAHIFFSVQLVEINTDYIKNLSRELQKFFVSIGCKDIQSLQKVQKTIIESVSYKTRTEDIEIKIGTYTFLVMVLHPVRKER